MEWTIAILFIAAVLLLIISLVKSKQHSKTEQREIDMIHLSLIDELEKLQKQIRNLELDVEILEKETGRQITSEDRELKREVLDLYKRKYSLESIATQKKLTKAEVEQILTPHFFEKERSKIVNEA